MNFFLNSFYQEMSNGVIMEAIFHNFYQKFMRENYFGGVNYKNKNINDCDLQIIRDQTYDTN